jgi:hypothetical protein
MRNGSPSETLKLVITIETGRTFVDWLIIVACASATLFLGWYFGKRQKSTRDYFVG